MKTTNPQIYRSPSRESPSHLKSCRNIPFVDYDEYDAQVFKIASSPPNTMPNKAFNAVQPSLRRNTVLSTQSSRPQRPMRRSSQMNFSEEFNSYANTPSNSPSRSDSMEIQSVPRYQSHLSPIQTHSSHLSTSVENKSIKGITKMP